jgi:hypothetical protein
MLYEIGDPACYVLPDVVCDFTQVRMDQAAPAAWGAPRVHVRGARGKPPTPTYKVCATYVDGFKFSAQLTIIGMDAVGKAQRTGEAVLERTSELIERAGLGPYTRTRIEVVGSEAAYGPHSAAQGAREVVMRLSAAHPKKDALELLAREIAPAGTSWSPGTTGSGGGRNSPAPSIKQFGFLLDKGLLQPNITVNGEVLPFSMRKMGLDVVQRPQAAPESIASTMPQGHLSDANTSVRLIEIAHARSGDKGDTSNIGVVARHADWLPVLRELLTPEAVKAYMAHAFKGRVTRYELPGIGGFNFVCEQALDGGGMASMRNDPLGKGMGQILLSMPIAVPMSLARSHGVG